MKQNDLLMSMDGCSLVRVLEVFDNQILVIDCLKRSMPVFLDPNSLKEYRSVKEKCLYEKTNYHPKPLEDLSPALRKKALNRYTMIAGALTALSDVKVRSQMIEKSAVDHTVRKVSTIL